MSLPIIISRTTTTLLTVVTFVSIASPLAAQDPTKVDTTRAQKLEGMRVLGTAEEEKKQAPGVSIITARDIERRPPANDLSELIRTMPGVNLTGNSSSGAYGNSRQIDLRGMGPENTLILIDGKPATSRNSVRMGRNGERNGRGDSNWVPADAIERIEVLRGPAAARYGSGASGGVINIITKRPSERLSGSVTAYGSMAENGDEGASRRIGFNLAGPIASAFSYRLYGNLAKTDPDKPGLNAEASGVTSDSATVPPAGREGVRNQDINALLRFDPSRKHIFELENSYSRQGNLYSGERLIGNGTALLSRLATEGAETNVMERRSSGLTYRGTYARNRSARVYAAYEGTTNTRLNEGLAGGVEGSIQDSVSWSTSRLKNFVVNGEYNAAVQFLGFFQTVSLGAEFNDSRLDDPYATRSGIAVSGDSTSVNSANTSAVYLEDNIGLRHDLTLTPGIRFDHHSLFGANWSPSVNISYAITPAFTIKSGIARAFKAPNLYQSNPNYMYTTRGNGCPFPSTGGSTRVTGPCNIFGNADLAPEISINKEIGVGYNRSGWNAGLAYFHNDYSNKIIADMGTQAVPDMVTVGGSTFRPFRWVNTGKAVVRGIEGNLNIPLYGESGNTLRLTNNLTSMFENKNVATGQPLSIIPDYTINSMLEWNPSRMLSLMPTAAFYGRQQPPTWDTGTNAQRAGDQLTSVDPYAILGMNIGFTLRGTSARLGVNNLANTRRFREAVGNAQGAATYNEPGRSFFLTVTQRI